MNLHKNYIKFKRGENYGEKDFFPYLFWRAWHPFSESLLQHMESRMLHLIMVSVELSTQSALETALGTTLQTPVPNQERDQSQQNSQLSILVD